MNDYNIHFTKPQVLAIPYPLTIVSTYTLPFHTGPGILLCGSMFFFLYVHRSLKETKHEENIHEIRFKQRTFPTYLVYLVC